MKRATITLPDDLEAAVDAYLAGHEAAPSLTSLVQAALRRYLAPPRREERAGRADATPAFEVSEAPAPYDLEETAGRIPPKAFLAGSGRRPAGARLGDLPALLADLPRLSGSEAEELADDLDAARIELAQTELADPWLRAADRPGPGSPRERKNATESEG